MQVAGRCQRHLTMAMTETHTNTCIHTYTTSYMYGHHSTRTGLVLSAMVKHMLEFDRQQLQYWMGLLLLRLLLRRNVKKICILANWCCCCLCWCSALTVVKMETLQLSISFWCAHCIAQRRRKECVCVSESWKLEERERARAKLTMAPSPAQRRKTTNALSDNYR